MIDPKSCTVCGLEIHYNDAEFSGAHDRRRQCFAAGQEIRASLIKARTACEKYVASTAKANARQGLLRKAFKEAIELTFGYDRHLGYKVADMFDAAVKEGR